MRAYTAVIQRCPDTGVYIGHVPGIPGAHSQGDSLDKINCLESDATATVR